MSRYDAVSAMQRRREAARRLPPLSCGCRDPWQHHCDKPTVRLSVALAALRRVWAFADNRDRETLASIAKVLTELAA